MSWRDTLKQAKFRDAKFEVDVETMGSFGRRLAVHEYPRRKSEIEDMGPRTPEHNLDAYVIGPNYHIARDALIKALNKEGPGTLTLPRLGVVKAHVKDARKIERSDKGGYCKFVLSFIESEAAESTITVNTQAALAVAANKSIADSINDFTENFAILEMAEDLVAELQDDLADIIGAIDNVVGSITGPISALIRAPANFAAQLLGGLGKIKNTLTEPVRAIGIYKGLFDSGKKNAATDTDGKQVDVSTVPQLTQQRKDQAQAQEQLRQLITRLAIALSCLVVAEDDPNASALGAVDDIVRVRDDLLDAIDNQLRSTSNVINDPATNSTLLGDPAFNTDVTNAPISGVVYASFQDLSGAINKDLIDRAASAPGLVDHTPLITLPAIVIAYQQHGDVAKEKDIVRLNKIKRAGFVPGGEPIKLLVNA